MIYFNCLLVHDMCQQLDVIGIDEAQFFEDLYDFCCTAADHDGKTVIVAGLDGDYLRWFFILSFHFHVWSSCSSLCLGC